MTGAIGKHIRKANTDHIEEARSMWITDLEPGPTKFMQGKKCVTFLLHIGTTNTAERHGMLLNRFEESDSKITSINHSEIQRFNKSRDDFDDLTEEQLAMPGFKGKKITFRNTWVQNKKVVGKTTCKFTNTRGYFTVQEMVKNIVKFEKVDRPKSCWFGGVDCHHIFFEGIYKNKDDKTYGICWGS
jgi:hypothetical protein